MYADSERAKGAAGAAAAAAAAAMEELDLGDVGAGWGEDDLGIGGGGAEAEGGFADAAGTCCERAYTVGNGRLALRFSPHPAVCILWYRRRRGGLCGRGRWGGGRRRRLGDGGGQGTGRRPGINNDPSAEHCTTPFASLALSATLLQAIQKECLPPPSLIFSLHPSPSQDLEIPADVAAEAAASAAAGEAAAFVAPTPGISAANRWQTKCSLAAEQAAAGAFDTAMRLLTRWVAGWRACKRATAATGDGRFWTMLHLLPFLTQAACFSWHASCSETTISPWRRRLVCRQIGIVNFEPLKPYFMEVFQGSHVRNTCRALVPCIAVAAMCVMALCKCIGAPNLQLHGDPPGADSTPGCLPA
jgi:hypothetical protein